MLCRVATLTLAIVLVARENRVWVATEEAVLVFVALIHVKFR